MSIPPIAQIDNESKILAPILMLSVKIGCKFYLFKNADTMRTRQK